MLIDFYLVVNNCNVFFVIHCLLNFVNHIYSLFDFLKFIIKFYLFDEFIVGEIDITKSTSLKRI